MVGRLVVLWSQITTGIGVLAILHCGPLIPYSTYQYVAAAVIIFVSTNVLEGIKTYASLDAKLSLFFSLYTDDIRMF